jgi:hypothetical protein
MQGKSVPIVLKDGKTRHLRFEWENICRLDREHKISIFDFGRDMIFASISPWKLTGVIWAGLLPEEPKLTIQDVEKLISFEDVMNQKIIEIVSEAIPTSFPEKEKEPEEVKKA